MTPSLQERELPDVGVTETYPVQGESIEVHGSGNHTAALARASATTSDEENLVLSGSQSSEDLLGAFYRRFPWPWQPVQVARLEDPDFERVMLNQNIGDWTHNTVPEHARIWVAGCGVNQALQTALRFPKCSVVGSDVSTTSLGICQRNARKLEINNLELREESINGAPYNAEFDYVICTGVIHHNADPQATLQRLSAALKPSGILELMVYNRFHRTVTSAFQKAIRLLGGSRGTADLDADLALARTIAANYPAKNQVSEMLADFKEGSESDFADLLIHPLEHSYTVESLEALAGSCGLEYVLPTVTSYGRFCSPSILWVLDFPDPTLRESYEALSDAQRWQVTNLLLLEKSPLLWFYLRKRGSRRTEQEIHDDFLTLEFEPAATRRKLFVLDDAGAFQPSRLMPYPSCPPEGVFADVIERLTPGKRMGQILSEVGIPETAAALHEARVMLTTSEFPHLRAVVRT